MSQSKSASHIESALNIASGFVLSLVVWHFLSRFLLFMEWDITDYEVNLFITTVFTFVSYWRSYGWRRFMNWLHVTGRWDRMLSGLDRFRRRLKP